MKFADRWMELGKKFILGEVTHIRNTNMIYIHHIWILAVKSLIKNLQSA